MGADGSDLLTLFSIREPIAGERPVRDIVGGATFTAGGESPSTEAF
jgi:hypothetical protein